jgi:hypothetical protein
MSEMNILLFPYSRILVYLDKSVAGAGRPSSLLVVAISSLVHHKVVARAALLPSAGKLEIALGEP